MASSVEIGEGAEALYKRVSSAMRVILSEEASDVGNDTIQETINIVEQCKLQVERENLFSKNEEIDDVQTSYIKFLWLDYYIAKCHQSLKGMEGRMINILSAKESFASFLSLCKRLDLLHAGDKEALEGTTGITPDAKRQNKIDKYKRDKAAKSRIMELQRQLYIARKDEEADEGDHDKELRELYLTQAQCYARESMDEIDMINQELVMLRFQEQQTQQQEQQRHPGGKEGGARAGREGGHGADSAPAPRMPPRQDGPGISVTRTFKVGDQIMFSRETVKATVFGSHIAPPTMSLEEFGDRQKAEALERQAQQPEDGAAHANRRYKQLVEDGDEDDAELVEKAIEKDRAWDDWKDNNPKGWGNKMGKRF